jgi:hypothetical protein
VARPVRIRLLKKLALLLNGVNLTPYSVGDEFVCSYADAHMLILEGWAEVVNENGIGMNCEPPSESMVAMIDRLREGQKER